jgi:tyrosyl-tRNA synthetase
VHSGLEKSWSRARQSIQSWALSLNEEKITDTNYDFRNNFIDWRFLLLRKGKKNYRIIRKK